MNRIGIKIVLGLTLLVGAGCAFGAQTRSYADALKKAGKSKPVVLFCYGANYDQVSLKTYETFIRSRNKEILHALGKESWVVVPVYQEPNDKEKKEYEKVMGNKWLPGGMWSIPCFLVMDGAGNFRGAVQSKEEMESPEAAAKALTTLLKNFTIQQKLIEESERASGDNKKKALQKALDVPGLKVPGHKEYDPVSSGLVDKVQSMSISEATTVIRDLLAGGPYTPLERQMILATLAGHVRHKGGSPAMLRSLYNEIKEIDPTSSFGIYAEGAIKLWAGGGSSPSSPSSSGTN